MYMVFVDLFDVLFDALDVFLDFFHIFLDLVDILLDFVDVLFDALDVFLDFFDVFGYRIKSGLASVDRHLDENRQIDCFKRQDCCQNEQYPVKRDAEHYQQKRYGKHDRVRHERLSGSDPAGGLDGDFFKSKRSSFHMHGMIHYVHMENHTHSHPENHAHDAPNKKLGLIKWAISLALIIIVNLVFYYAIATLYPEPKLEGFCPVQPAVYTEAVTCVENGGQWTNNQLTPAEITTQVKNGTPLGWCDANFTCQKNFNHAHSIYDRNVFIILIVLSLAIIAIAIFSSVEILSVGFAWAGVLSLLIASLRYWSDAENWMRLIILVVALAVLVWLAVKRFRE